MTTKVNYKDLNLENFQIVKDEEKKITYNVLYNEKKWNLKIPSSKIRNNIIKSDDYYVLEVNCSKDIAKMLTNIDEYIINKSCKILEKDEAKIHDIFKHTVHFSDDSPYIRLRINDNTKIYDKVGQVIKDECFNDLFKSSDKIGLLLKLENVRIGSGIIKVNWYIDQVKLQKIVTDCQISDSESENESDNDNDSDNDEESKYY